MESQGKTKWVIDPTHTEITFKVKHLMITNVNGTFRDYHATVYTSGDNHLTSDIEFAMKAASVDTGVNDRDNHLRSADFFDAENFSEITFSGKSVEKKGDNDYLLNGDLTIKGITKPVTLTVEFSGLMKDPWGNIKAGYTVEGKINRKDWELTWNAALETGGVLVGDEVKINCEVQLVKQQ